MTTQADAVRAWWADLDELGRARALRLRGDDELPADMRLGLSMAGVRVERLPGDVEVYVVPAVLLDVLDTERT